MSLGIVLAGAVLTGCASHTRPAPPPPIRGYVNLEALMRRHPGWSGISQYDAALRRLQTAAGSLPPQSRPDQKIATLPALPPASAAVAAALPVGDARHIQSRLPAVQQSLVDTMQSRREMARQDQLRSQQDLWRRAARLQFPFSRDTSAIGPDLELQLLQANVETLTRTLNNWKDSVPPAPDQQALHAKVEADRARLEGLIAARLQARGAAQARAAEALLNIRQARLAYVATQAQNLETRLRGDDERFLAGQQAHLVRQRAALLEALARPVLVSVPVTGNIGAQTLPKGPGEPQAALSRVALTNAEKRLQAQRARWMDYLRDDTQAAARDAAGRHNWDVTFGRPRPGDRDLTQALAQALTTDVWRM